jgi:drug/metabolite transporter (DMT)-like permease
MTRAIFAVAAYWASSLALTFANQFVMQVLRDPFTLLLSQVVITLTFSFCAFCCLKLEGFNAFFDIQKSGWFAAIGFSSFVGWAASLEGLKSGSVATLTMIKAVNPILAAILAKFFLPSSEPHHWNARLAWVVLSGVGCCFYVYDRATADYRACFFFFVSALSASLNTISLKRMQLHSLLPSDALSSVLCSSAFINAAALPFIFFAFLETVSSDATIQVCFFVNQMSCLIIIWT